MAIGLRDFVDLRRGRTRCAGRSGYGHSAMCLTGTFESPAFPRKSQKNQRVSRLLQSPYCHRDASIAGNSFRCGSDHSPTRPLAIATAARGPQCHRHQRDRSEDHGGVVCHSLHDRDRRVKGRIANTMCVKDAAAKIYHCWLVTSRCLLMADNVEKGF